MIYIFFAFFNCLLDRVHTKIPELRYFYCFFHAGLDKGGMLVYTLL